MAIQFPSPMYNPSYGGVVAITPADATPIAGTPGGYIEAFMVTVAGNVAIVTQRDQTVTIPCLVGVIYKIRASSVNATNTTATGILGLF